MTLLKYRPYRGILTLQDEVNRVFDSLVHPQGTTESWFPASDVRESEGEYIIRAELPGVKKEDVKISLVNNTLILRGEKKAETEEKKGNWHHVERTYGTFERTFALPSPVSAEKIRAKVSEGILEIVVPKADEARPREIQIEN